MSPAQPREPLQQRVYRELAAALTARLEGQALSWTAVHTAERRRQARVRLTFARGLEASGTYPGVAEARMVLAEDAPEQAAHDAALVRCWRQVHGIIVDTAGARARIAERLEVVARRQSASQETVLRYPRVHTQYAAGSSVGPADRPL
jgi:hypothetical protein